MTAGVDYKKGTLFKFVLITSFIGPILASILLSVCFRIYIEIYFLTTEQVYTELKLNLYRDIWFAIPVLGFVFGVIPAFLSALCCCLIFKKKRFLELRIILLVTALWCGSASFILYPFNPFTDPGIKIMLPVVFGILSAGLIWHFRPRKWIGPLTKKELAIWRVEQAEFAQ